MQGSFDRFGDAFSTAKQVLKSVKYLRKQLGAAITAEQTEQLQIIEALGQIAVALAVKVNKRQRPAALSLGASDLFRQSQDKDYDVVDEINTVSQAQLQPLLAQLPPMKKPGAGGGGAASMSMSDPVQDAFDAAAASLIAGLLLLESSFSPESQFGSDSRATSFFAYLFAHKPAQAEEVGDSLEQALSSAK
ncbi:MAG: hypothetical protein SFV17_10185 [Candidatus Obscuribacter sp.]|nr:hypothetical protein [Candidatus Obscuribacter sp.]